jgi:cytochrome c
MSNQMGVRFINKEKTMLKHIITTIAITTTAGTMAMAEGDIEKGAKTFKKCKSCHRIGEGAKNGVGPLLTGVVGREVASVEGFKYSKSMIAFGAEGAVWDEATLSAFLANPKGTVPKTKMTFKGLKKETDIANIIAYLATFE